MLRLVIVPHYAVFPAELVSYGIFLLLFRLYLVGMGSFVFAHEIRSPSSTGTEYITSLYGARRNSAAIRSGTPPSSCNTFVA